MSEKRDNPIPDAEIVLLAALRRAQKNGGFVEMTTAELVQIRDHIFDLQRQLKAKP